MVIVVRNIHLLHEHGAVQLFVMNRPQRSLPWIKPVGLYCKKRMFALDRISRAITVSELTATIQLWLRMWKLLKWMIILSGSFNVLTSRTAALIAAEFSKWCTAVSFYPVRLLWNFAPRDVWFESRPAHSLSWCFPWLSSVSPGSTSIRPKQVPSKPFSTCHSLFIWSPSALQSETLRAS
jgi:hypothetical protein